jgi:hypothetical protein
MLFSGVTGVSLFAIQTSAQSDNQTSAQSDNQTGGNLTNGNRTPETATPPPTSEPSKPCDPSYSGVCIPPFPPDLNCGDISDRRFTVLPPDPHGFDGDNDGIGCE